MYLQCCCTFISGTTGAVGVAKKNWTITEINANFWKAKFFNPNDETKFDFLIRWFPRAHTECPASLLNNWAQATWALCVRPGDSSDQKIKMGFIIRDVKLSFLEICSNIHDVVATPNVMWSISFENWKFKTYWKFVKDLQICSNFWCTLM